MWGRLGACCRMTGKTSLIVICGIPRNFLVRIMARDATNAGIGAIEAFAVCQTIRLETHVRWASPPSSHHQFPRSMTLAAESRDVFRRQASQPRRSCIEISSCGGGQVSACANVAMLTGHPRLERGEIQLVVNDGVRCVASKTTRYTLFIERPANGLFKAFGNYVVVSHGKIKAFNRGIVADHALVHAAAVLENPGLRLRAHRP